MHFTNDFILSDNTKSDVDPEARRRVGKFLDDLTEKYQIGPFNIEKESKIGGINEFTLSKCDNINSIMFDAAKELLGHGYSLQLSTAMVKIGAMGECRPETRFVVKVLPTERKFTQFVTRIKAMWNSMERSRRSMDIYAGRNKTQREVVFSEIPLEQVIPEHRDILLSVSKVILCLKYPEHKIKEWKVNINDRDYTIFCQFQTFFPVFLSDMTTIQMINDLLIENVWTYSTQQGTVICTTVRKPEFFAQMEIKELKIIVNKVQDNQKSLKRSRTDNNKF